MDGSVSTLAPVFAAAFATHAAWNAFLVGLAASLGTGLSMGFAEALADDDKDFGTPLLRGFVCGPMTIAGGIGQTLPYLPSGRPYRDDRGGGGGRARTAGHRLHPVAYRDTPPLSAVAKVVLGGGLVLATEVLIGNAG